ncbi:hypothetical protein KI387_004858 [Taxus chinensis]|uniref:Fe2OG dioxygenase domain-containing protein n=1 Tax=Taxus chinensis TaxID=29808 RepID=A0AA38LJ49_TAXCH|nr:hypothetical protein KI387_004858 [Taxus chinensis]
MEDLLKQIERLERPIDLVQNLHERQVKEVPARYVLPCDRRPSPALQAQQSIPVINLAANHSETVSQISQASQDWGFFQIINHGIPLSMLERINGVSKEFFDLPLEEKRRQCPVRPGTNMLEGYGRFFDVSDDTVLDWVDALVHYISPSSIKAVEHWPKNPETYRETFEKYGEEPDLVHGLKPHSDGSLLTVLLDNEVEGLQVRKGTEWYNVIRVPGALVVNIGDILQIISNGKYKSAEHRAGASTDKFRMSTVMFLASQVDVMIAPAPELLDEAHPRLYQPTIAGEYVANYMSKDTLGKTSVEALLIEQK